MKSFFKKITVAILTWEARLVVRRRKPSVVAITGSVGKTSTKDAVAALLQNHASVRQSPKSFNSEIGVPLTILGLRNAWNNPLRWLQIFFDGLIVAFLGTGYPDWLVLEIGADRPGDIRSIASWLPIDIAIITRLPEVPVHVEFFDSPEEVMEEKASLIAGLKSSGTLILYADDERVAALHERAPAGARVITFGFSGVADVHADQPEFLLDEQGSPIGMRSIVHVAQERGELILRGAVGTHAFMPLLAALAVALSLDQTLAESLQPLNEAYVPPSGRMHLIAGTQGSVLIDDTYNSSPAAVEAALMTLLALPATDLLTGKQGRKIAVLSDMMELGKYSVPEHRRMGMLAAECLGRGSGDNRLMTVGIRARDIAAAAIEAGMPDANILQFENSEEAGAELARTIKAHDTVLIKGSQSMRMEKAVKLAMAEPERAGELLVRQEKEWEQR